MDQRKLTGKKIKRAWFVRIGPFGGMMPWSWQGWLWFASVVAGSLTAGFHMHRAGLGDIDYWGIALVLILVIGLVVGLAKSTRL